MKKNIFAICMVTAAGCMATLTAQTKGAETLVPLTERVNVNPEKPDVPLNKNDAYKKNSEPGPILHDQSPPFFFHLNPL